MASSSSYSGVCICKDCGVWRHPNKKHICHKNRISGDYYCVHCSARFTAPASVETHINGCSIAAESLIARTDKAELIKITGSDEVMGLVLAYLRHITPFAQRDREIERFESKYNITFKDEILNDLRIKGHHKSETGTKRPAPSASSHSRSSSSSSSSDDEKDEEDEENEDDDQSKSSKQYAAKRSKPSIPNVTPKPVAPAIKTPLSGVSKPVTGSQVTANQVTGRQVTANQVTPAKPVTPVPKPIVKPVSKPVADPISPGFMDDDDTPPASSQTKPQVTSQGATSKVVSKPVPVSDSKQSSKSITVEQIADRFMQIMQKRVDNNTLLQICDALNDNLDTFDKRLSEFKSREIGLIQNDSLLATAHLISSLVQLEDALKGLALPRLANGPVSSDEITAASNNIEDSSDDEKNTELLTNRRQEMAANAAKTFFPESSSDSSVDDLMSIIDYMREQGKFHEAKKKYINLTRKRAWNILTSLKTTYESTPLGKSVPITIPSLLLNIYSQ